MIDYERVSKILLTELRNGKLGPLTLETPEMAEREKVEVAAKIKEQAEAKEKKKSERKARFKERQKRRR